METVERSRRNHQKIIENLVADLGFPVEVLLDDREILPDKDDVFEFLFERFQEKYLWELDKYTEIERTSYECDFKSMLFISDQIEGANKRVGKGKKFARKNGAKYMDAATFFAPDTEIPSLQVNLMKVKEGDWSEEMNAKFEKHCNRRNKGKRGMPRNHSEGKRRKEKEKGRKRGTVATVVDAENGKGKHTVEKRESTIIPARLIEDCSIPYKETGERN